MEDGDGESATAVVIDIHAHVMTPEAEEIAAPLFTPDKDPFIGFSGPTSDAYNRTHFAEIVPSLTQPEQRLRDMDRMGVDIQAISVVPPQYFYWAEPQIGAKLSGMVNDRLFEIVQGHPDRFVGLGTLPLQDVDLALGELERVVEELRFGGLEICTNVNGVDFDDPRFVPFFEKVVEHDLLLVVHPNGFTHGERLADYYLINTVGMPMDSTVFIARMIFGGVLERFPDAEGLRDARRRIPAVLPGPVRSRLRSSGTIVASTSAGPPSTYLAQMYFDTMVFDPDMLSTLVQALGRRPRAPGHGLSVRHGRVRSPRACSARSRT